jgi:HSP90 family molecular chaperone
LLKHTINFTVDAALIQELGQRLIGQPQIALAELVKNSYDADAFTCRITFSKDRIEINDDGHGMALDEFRNYWMRIATTHKLEDRHSRKLKRPLTGSKGIGRLAAQFLAKDLTLETSAEPDPAQCSMRSSIGEKLNRVRTYSPY